jgi:hypothetical protein
LTKIILINKMSSINPSDIYGQRIHGLSPEGSLSVSRVLGEIKEEIMTTVQGSIETLRNEIQMLTNLVLRITKNNQQQPQDSKDNSPSASRKSSKENGVTINHEIHNHISGNSAMSPTGGIINMTSTMPPNSFGNSPNDSANFAGTRTNVATSITSTAPATTAHTPNHEGLCPIDNRQRLPIVQNLKLDEVNVTPEKFELFAHRLLMELKAISKYDGILTDPIAESWRMCKERNSTKYPSGEQLEYSYLELHQQVCVYIGRHISDRLFYTFNNEMKAENHDIPRELGFVKNHKIMYENANILWNKIKDRYAHKSVYKSGDLMDAWHNLRYDGRSDPRKFLNDYHEIHAQGRLTSVNFPLLNDTAKAQDIIRKCPNTPECSILRDKFLRENVTMAEVTEGLILWYLEQKRIGRDRRESIPSRPAPSPSGNRTPRSVMSNQENHSNRGRSPHRRDHRDSSRSRSRSEGRPRSRTPSQNQGPRNEEGTETRTIENNEDDDNDGSIPKLVFCCVATPEDQPMDETFTGAHNAGYYIPTRDEGIDDTGSDTVLTPRLDLLTKIKGILPIKISGIAGQSSAHQEGVLELTKHIDVTKVKYVPNSRFTILAAFPFVESGQFTKVYNNKGSYLIPSKLVPQDVLDKHSVFTAQRKGKLYVFTVDKKGSGHTQSSMGFYPNGKNTPSNKNVSTNKTPKIPKKTVPPTTVIRKLNMTEEKTTQDPKPQGTVSVVPNLSQSLVNVHTRSRSQGRSGSPYPNTTSQEEPASDTEEHIEQEPESPMTPYETSEY